MSASGSVWNIFDAALAQRRVGFGDKMQQNARKALILHEITQQELVSLEIAQQGFAFSVHRRTLARGRRPPIALDQV